ncbi:MAG: hypothetical protein MJ016_05430 [Victivallaceae bacterium]|nr:hypothetical protein [Victivallaceae bacterium]
MKYLALDIGNVCLEIDQQSAWEAMGFPGLDGDLLPLIAAHETGRMPTAEALRRIAALSDVKGKSEADLLRIFLDIIVKPKPRMTELISSLPARGIQPIFFSDISIPHLEKTRRIFAPAAGNPCGIYSCEVGAMKPDERMFRAFEARFGKPFLYVDDRADLIAAALRRGWRAHRFTDAEDLEKTLFSR